MTQTYRIRGSKPPAQPAPPQTSDIAITHTTRLLPGLGRAGGSDDINAAAAVGAGKGGMLMSLRIP